MRSRIQTKKGFSGLRTLRLESLEPRLALSGADDYGNDFWHATPITLDTWGNGAIGGTIEQAGDTDWFWFTTNAPGRLIVTQSVLTGSRLDSFVYLINTRGLVEASNDDSGGTNNSRVEIDVAAGTTFCVKAAAYGNSTGAYRVDVRTALWTVDDVGNDFAQAAVLSLSNPGNATRDAAIHVARDADMFRFVSLSTGSMVITQSALPGSKVDPYLYAYDGSQKLLASNDDSGGTNNSRVEINVVAGATYYVKAAAYGNSTGVYHLELVTRPAPDDVGNTYAAAAGLPLSAQGAAFRSAVIEQPGDIDVFRVVATVTGQMTVIESAASGSRVDPFVTVYNASQTLVAQDNNSGGGTSARVTFSVIAGTTYYVGARAAGNTAGAYVIQISTALPPPPPPGNFQITLSFVGLTASQQQLARQAAARWERIIVGDLPDVQYGTRRIDDLLVNVTGRSLDGVGKVLANAKPDLYRNGGGLPYLGTVTVDTADIANLESERELTDVLTHELGHVLGLGTIWQSRGLLAGANTADPRFLGPRATAEYNRVFGVSTYGVPVEAEGDPGTRLGHWDDDLFRTELMTGWNKHGASPLSRITVASMADLGYQVNMAGAEPYSAPAVRAMAGAAATSSPGAQSAPASASALEFAVASEKQFSRDRLTQEASPGFVRADLADIAWAQFAALTARRETRPSPFRGGPVGLERLDSAAYDLALCRHNLHESVG